MLARGVGRSTGSHAKRPEILLLPALLQHKPLYSVPDPGRVGAAGTAWNLRQVAG